MSVDTQRTHDSDAPRSVTVGLKNRYLDWHRALWSAMERSWGDH